jgi:uncharacterized membrane protein
MNKEDKLIFIGWIATIVLCAIVLIGGFVLTLLGTIAREIPLVGGIALLLTIVWCTIILVLAIINRINKNKDDETV